jgi:chemotaxis protein MotA
MSTDRQRSFAATTPLGLVAAFGVLLVAVVLEGGSPLSILNLPAFLIVCGGTCAATLASTTIGEFRRIPRLYRIAFRGRPPQWRAGIRALARLAEKARREGLLALEDELPAIDDEFARGGVQLVVDGVDSELVRAMLYSEIDAMSGRHAKGAHVFTVAGGFAPTLGILGTVLSLVHVLENLSTPRLLGHSIAGAFLATLYGVGSANLLYLPVSNKLKELASEELAYREMLVEAILAIQAGDNPRMLRDRLETFLPPDERGREPVPLRVVPSPAPEPVLEEALDYV